MDKNFRKLLKDKQKIVVKIGSSSITHESTGNINYKKLEKLVRVLCDIKNEGKDIVLVSSGAIAVGRQTVGLTEKPSVLAQKQACAAIGQCRLMMTYQKLFAEYNQTAAQILMTKYTLLNEESLKNAKNTFEELFKFGAIPVVNENDTISTYEIEFGDNDRLSALVCALIGADLLILLSDIDGLFTDDPNVNPDAKFIDVVTSIDNDIKEMAKGSQSNVGTGGMTAKLTAATIATESGADMVIANSEEVGVIQRIIDGDTVGTLFVAQPNDNFNFDNYIS